MRFKLNFNPRCCVFAFAKTLWVVEKLWVTPLIVLCKEPVECKKKKEESGVSARELQNLNFRLR